MSSNITNACPSQDNTSQLYLMIGTIVVSVLSLISSVVTMMFVRNQTSTDRSEVIITGMKHGDYAIESIKFTATDTDTKISGAAWRSSSAAEPTAVEGASGTNLAETLTAKAFAFLREFFSNTTPMPVVTVHTSADSTLAGDTSRVDPIDGNGLRE